MVGWDVAVVAAGVGMLVAPGARVGAGEKVVPAVQPR